MNGLLGAADCAIFAAGVVWWVGRCDVGDVKRRICFRSCLCIGRTRMFWMACLFFVAKVLSGKVLGKEKKSMESRARVCFARL
jgi:hypothetical protein